MIAVVSTLWTSLIHAPASRDEHKVVFGARTIKEAKSIYDGGFSDGSGPRLSRHVHETSPDGLKDWLDGAETHRPFAEAA